MDPEVALGLFEEGATLVLLGVPQGSVLGLDYKSWTLGPRFRGVKMIPPGLHFLHFCSASTSEACGDVGPKMGLFLSLKPREVLVAHWNPREEDLEFSRDPEEAERIRANLQRAGWVSGPLSLRDTPKMGLPDRQTEPGAGLRSAAPQREGVRLQRRDPGAAADPH